MYKDKTILAIIPARGGSKRLPNKNILPLAGKPLISWTIEASLGSKFLDKIIVTSDSDKILDIAKEYEVLTIKRPTELATDTASTIEVVEHVLSNIDKKFDFIVLLQPTSPLRTAKHIDEAIEFLFEKNADAVISVCEVDHSPLWCNTLPEGLDMSNFLSDDIKGKRSQDLPKFYRINGAIYICKTEKFLEEDTFFIKDNIYAYIMDKMSSIDIDDEFDLKLAEILMEG
ncbi:acylneuraminate cytidylyltransferase [Deferribacter desulfuricans SSM1]|uniref:Acylneuraminate cytidylyltransferase n=1 Tax=Deferribacter desulfuricans (strain DSM 14783 / JCM 11476 / NBRC 101012 / SSM1) TaxID=639282 RepID=D3PB99_DEFDS|nr:acylneuraminate cytidylyltransferase family protein [Deferribacter desulfuricans]BAI79872.1 acylneuraminate cytidylyltransferase [Deferribacter desulfuricans SSM1]